MKKDDRLGGWGTAAEWAGESDRVAGTTVVSAVTRRHRVRIANEPMWRKEAWRPGYSEILSPKRGLIQCAVIAMLAGASALGCSPAYAQSADDSSSATMSLAQEVKTDGLGLAGAWAQYWTGDSCSVYAQAATNLVAGLANSEMGGGTQEGVLALASEDPFLVLSWIATELGKIGLEHGVRVLANDLCDPELAERVRRSHPDWPSWLWPSPRQAFNAPGLSRGVAPRNAFPGTVVRGHVPPVREPSALGIRTHNLSSAQQASLGLHGEGIIVDYVWTHSPAAAAGLRPGDILLYLNGSPLFGTDDALDRITRTGVAARVVLYLQRGETKFYTTTTLTSPGRVY